MEGASLNTAENSGLPTGQLILLQNSTDSNKKSSSELGDAKDSGCHCVEGRLDDGSGVGVGVGAGAGAIAGPRADVRLVTSNSLSELVWSPRKGLRVKCAKCSIHDNVIPPPSQNLTIRETVYANISMTKEGLNKDKDLEVLTKKIEKSITDIPKDDDQSIRKGKEICDQMDMQIIDGSFSRTTRSSVPKRTPIPGTPTTSSYPSSQFMYTKFLSGPDSGTYNGFFIGGKGNPGLASADPENKKGTFSNQFASVEASKSQEDPSPILCSPSRRDDKLSVSEDVKSNKMIIGFNQVPQGKQESISENDLQLVKGESEQTEVDKLKSTLPYEDNPLAETSPDDNKIPCCQAAEADTNDKEISSNPVGREENVLLKVEATAWKSGDEDDSHESVESCSSTGLFLTRKRPLGYKEKLVCDEKRLKNENCGNPESTSPHPRNSSFISWISNMMKGVGKANTDATPLALTVIPHHENDQSVDLHKTNQESGSIAGFEGIFKAMYCPTLNMRGTRILPLDHTPEEVSNELELANKTCSDSSTPVASGEDNSKLCKKDTSSGDGRLKLGQFGNNEGPCMPDIASKNVTVYLDNSPGVAEINSPFNIPNSHGTSGSKSSISLQVESDSSSQGKEAKSFCFTNPNKSLHNVPSTSGSLGNLWISRFLPKASGNNVNPPPCDHDVYTLFEGSSNSVRLLPQPLRSGPFVKDQIMFEGSGKACTEEQVDVACRRNANDAGSFGSLKITEHIDQKSKPKLNLIQTSQRSKGSEAMTSVFARRLDAFKNIKSSEKSSSITNIMTTCFFCGANGHDLRNCSKITETEIGFFQKAHSFDGAGELSCYCIRCFQLNHWAISCPNTLLRKRSHSDSCCFPDFRKQLNFSTNIELSDNEEKIPVEMNSGECSVARTGFVGKKPRVSSEMIDDIDSKEKLINDKANEFESGLYQMKNILSSFKNEAREDQVSALCNFVTRQIPAVPRETFEAIKKLRLSRTDILKWMKSPASLFGLDGFFLRLRLKKLEGLDGSSYHVACINGASGKSLQGAEIPFTVNIGGLKTLVESRYVSNHEFVEDELMAWWRAILKSGNELPSEADLKMKLQVRKIYGF